MRSDTIERLSRFIYISTATEEFSDQSLNKLIDRSSAFNRDNQITGVLTYHEQAFFQVLEGSRSNVETLLGRIVFDARHHTVLVLSRSEVKQRLFSSWSMGWVSPSALKRTGFDLGYLHLRTMPDILMDGVLQAFQASLPLSRTHRTVLGFAP